MKMNSLNLNDIFRFVITGYVFYLVTTFLKVNHAISILKSSTTFEKQLEILIYGIFIYFLYRTIVYPYFILKISDFFNPNECIRNNILMKYEQVSWPEANDIYHIIIQKEPKLDMDKSRVWTHSIHMLFITGIITFFGFLYSLTKGMFFEVQILAVSTFVFLISAFMSDIALEKRIFRNVVKLHQEEYEKILNDYFSCKENLNKEKKET